MAWQGAPYATEQHNYDCSQSGRGHALLAPPMPNLPGYSYPAHALQQAASQLGMRKSKGATLKYVKGYRMVVDPVVLSDDPLNLSRYNMLPGQEQLMQQVQQQKQLQEERRAKELQAAAVPTWGGHTMKWTGRKTPGWLMYDKKVLRFYAYSTEKVQHSPLEQVRVRRFDLCYHMEDGSLEVNEPQEANSGLPQGKYLHRSKVKMADGVDLKHDALYIGAEVTIYCRKFKLVGCDAQTREFFAHDLNQPQPPDLPMPQGKFDVDKKAKEDFEEEHRRPVSPRTLAKKKADNPENEEEPTWGPAAIFSLSGSRRAQDVLDRKVLRFYCSWDDTKQDGQKLPFAIHYFLQDDTVEVVEMHQRNTGRDPWPLLLSRCKLPKTPNVPPVGGRPLSPDSRRKLNIQYYHWKDLRIGTLIGVYGRGLLVYDMDTFTRTWLRDQLGLGPKELAATEMDFSTGPKRPPMMVPPNTNGIGSEEDSLSNVLYLVPRRPLPHTYNHYMDNWNKVLRFSARMVPVPGEPLVGPHDADRRFVLSFYLLDNTVAIFEPKQANSGIRGGTFLERIKVKKHKQEVFLAATDFQVGGQVTIYSRHFQLTEADTYTLRHMESEPDKYPYANYDLIMRQVLAGLGGRQGEERLAAVIHNNQGESSQLTATQVQAALRLAGVVLSLHEAGTVVRELGEPDGLTMEAAYLLEALGLVTPPPPLATSGAAPSLAQLYEEDWGRQPQDTQTPSRLTQAPQQPGQHADQMQAREIQNQQAGQLGRSYEWGPQPGQGQQAPDYGQEAHYEQAYLAPQVASQQYPASANGRPARAGPAHAATSHSFAPRPHEERSYGTSEQEVGRSITWEQAPPVSREAWGGVPPRVPGPQLASEQPQGHMNAQRRRQDTPEAVAASQAGRKQAWATAASSITDTRYKQQPNGQRGQHANGQQLPAAHRPSDGLYYSSATVVTKPSTTGPPSGKQEASRSHADASQSPRKSGSPPARPRSALQHAHGMRPHDQNAYAQLFSGGDTAYHARNVHALGQDARSAGDQNNACPASEGGVAMRPPRWGEDVTSPRYPSAARSGEGSAYRDTSPHHDQRPMITNPPPSEWLVQAQAKQGDRDQRLQTRALHGQAAPVMLNSNPAQDLVRQPHDLTRGSQRWSADQTDGREIAERGKPFYLTDPGVPEGMTRGAAIKQDMGTWGEGQENRTSQGGEPPRDARFLVPPGRVGSYQAPLQSKTSSQQPPSQLRAELSSTALQPNRAAGDRLASFAQPQSLWQTSNQSLGGVHNGKSATLVNRLW